jgi:hypothetical protein
VRRGKYFPGSLGSRAEASWVGPFARASLAGAVCDERVHFAGERHPCRVQRNETTFDTPAYRFFDLRAAAMEAGLDDKEDATARKAACRERGG